VICDAILERNSGPSGYARVGSVGVVTSLILLDCKNVEFQKLALNLSAYEIIKDVFLFPFLVHLI
jgi:hypothetical protein